MRRARWIALSVAATSVLMLASPLGAQTTQTPPADERVPAQPAPVPPLPPGPAGPVPTPPPTEERPLEEAPAPEQLEQVVEPQPVPEELPTTEAPTGIFPRVFIDPDLFNPPAHQGWINITPSFTLSGEYNDNLFLTREDRTSDGLIGFSPGLTLSMRRPNYRLFAGYYTSGQIFFNEDDLNGFGDRQRLFVDGSYLVSPRLSLSVTDRFILSESTNAVTISGVAAGRRDSWRNTLTPRLRFQATPNTSLNALVSHTMLRFQDEDQDSDTYRLGLGANHRITERLTGLLDLRAAYIDFRSDREDAWTYSPNLGVSYAFTRTLRGSVRAGPLFTDRDGETTVTPSVSAVAVQAFRFGSVALGYTRAVTAETIGLSDRQVIFGSLLAPTLMRGLQVSLDPNYSIVDRDVAGTDRTVKVLRLNLRATYQIARGISLIGSYTFFNQAETRTDDIDQNRVFLGVQYAYPITIY